MPVEIVTVPPKDHDGNSIDHETQDRDPDGIVIVDYNGIHESLQALDGHDECESCEKHSARETSQRVDLACAEAEARVVCVSPRVDVGQGAESQRHGVGGHVKPVRQERHGAEG